MRFIMFRYVVLLVVLSPPRCLLAERINYIYGEHLGCYRDAPLRDLNGSMIGHDYMSVEKCLEFCFSKGYAFAALQYGYLCACGDSYGRYERTPDACNMTCKMNARQMCGGAWKNDIYRIISHALDVRITSNYLGCYQDGGERDLQGSVFEDQEMTPSKCFKYCLSLNFNIAGLQYSFQCFCGNSYGRHGMIDESFCDTPCAGSTKNFCGGTWKNSIYIISGVAKTLSHDALVLADTPGDTLSVEVQQAKKKTGVDGENENSTELITNSTMSQNNVTLQPEIIVSATNIKSDKANLTTTTMTTTRLTTEGVPLSPKWPQISNETVDMLMAKQTKDWQTTTPKVPEIRHEVNANLVEPQPERLPWATMRTFSFTPPTTNAPSASGDSTSESSVWPIIVHETLDEQIAKMHGFKWPKIATLQPAAMPPPTSRPKLVWPKFREDPSDNEVKVTEPLPLVLLTRLFEKTNITTMVSKKVVTAPTVAELTQPTASSLQKQDD